MTKKRTKGQHSVPQSYLRSFATGAGRKAMVYVYERNKPEPFKQKPNQAARETNYYSFRRSDGTWDDGVESLLQMVEGKAVPVLKRMAVDDVHVDWEGRNWVALFIAFQELRVSWTRKNFENVYVQLIRRLTELRASVPGQLERDLETLEREGNSMEGVTPDSLREFLRRGEYRLRISPVFSLATMLEMAPLLFSFYFEMKWTILRAPEGSFFVTSDNPVVKFDPEHRGGFNGIALISPTIEIRVPISKSSCLLITHDCKRQETWHELMKAGKEAEAKELRQAIPPTEYVQVDQHVVDTVNKLTVAYAARFVYSAIKDSGIPPMMTGEPQGVRFEVG